MRWKPCKDGIEIRRGSRSVTLMGLQGDGFMWKLADWGIHETEPEAIERAETVFDMPETLKQLLAESLAIHRDSLESNDAPDCECDACKRFRSIIARIEAVLR